MAWGLRTSMSPSMQAEDRRTKTNAIDAARTAYLAWAACESSLFAALLCGTAAALGVVSGLSLLAALLVDACKCAQGTRTLVLLRPSSVPASAIKTLGAKKMQRLVFSHLAPPAPAF